MVSLLEERANLIALAANSLYAACDLILLCSEPLLELHFVAFAIAEAS